MGASKKIKQILIDKEMTQNQFAELVLPDAKNPHQQMRNYLYKDSMHYATVEKWLDALGYDICFRDRETGKLFR